MTQSAIRHCRLLMGIPYVVMHPSLRLKPQPKRLPYKFFFVQASMRSSALSMFSIEFATLKRR